jgi:hypothetical protein
MDRDDDAGALLAPGIWVIHPSEPDWGFGQVQSAIGARVTVNFEHAGKRVINAEIVHLREVAPEDIPPLT